MKRIIICLTLLIGLNLISVKGFSQKDQTLFFGVNVGAKLANKNYALRYSGAYQDELYYALSNPNHYNAIYILLGDKGFYMPFDSYPTNIRYSPGIVTGVTAGYQVSPNFQMSLDANFSKLKIKDAFTIVVEDPSNWTAEPVIEVGQLYAEESRFDGRFNLDYVFDGDKVKFISGVSGIFTAWRIDEHFASIRGYNIQLFSKHNPINNFTNKVSGLGWGGGINLGIEYRVNDKIVSQLLYQPYHTAVNYGFNINKRILIQHDLTLRLLWK
jgi:hypothetical protein